jgi:uncharacterized membrane protein
MPPQSSPPFGIPIEQIGGLVDIAGVFVIVFGIAYATIRYLITMRSTIDRYREYRQNLGKAILLGLEMLVAGDIIRTVGVQPTMSSVLVLAVIVAIRTFLSWSLDVELEGKWPWQSDRIGKTETLTGSQAIPGVNP